MNRLALEHILIVDLAQAWAGAYATQILADHGATVIKVEARQRMDSWRLAGAGNTYPADGPGERPHNRNWLTNSVNRNKLGVTIDLTREQGKELFRGLVRQADVVAENFTPHVMKQFGLDFEALRSIRPGLIMLSMPAFGGTGPYGEYPGIGGTIEPMSGNSYLLGYEGGQPRNSGVMYSDPIAGMMGAAAVLTALHYRSQTGRGQHIDLSQQEAMATMIGYHVVSYSLTDDVPGRKGNRDPRYAPHRCYRCRGKEQWVAVAVHDDADWVRLCEAICRPELSADPRLATVEARLENRAIADLIVEGWTEERTPEEVEGSLLTAGVPVGKARNMAEVDACPQLNAREFFVTAGHREVGPRRTAGIPARLSRSPGAIRYGSPCLGEHSALVFRRYLGLSDEETAALEAEGITGEVPFPRTARGA